LDPTGNVLGDLRFRATGTRLSRRAPYDCIGGLSGVVLHTPEKSIAVDATVNLRCRIGCRTPRAGKIAGRFVVCPDAARTADGSTAAGLGGITPTQSIVKVIIQCLTG